MPARAVFDLKTAFKKNLKNFTDIFGVEGVFILPGKQSSIGGTVNSIERKYTKVL